MLHAPTSTGDRVLSTSYPPPPKHPRPARSSSAPSNAIGASRPRGPRDPPPRLQSRVPRPRPGPPRYLAVEEEDLVPRGLPQHFLHSEAGERKVDRGRGAIPNAGCLGFLVLCAGGFWPCGGHFALPLARWRGRVRHVVHGRARLRRPRRAAPRPPARVAATTTPGMLRALTPATFRGTDFSPGTEWM